ncbi:porin [Celeribacter sp.]|uniref:porin n=1 Tax=Celeribacter sp. TaxID=1890673 RepID=UPI003A9278ED
MKNILLSSAAIVALAGAASAEVTFGGDATLGYNDDVKDAAGVSNFYVDAGLDVALSAELNNGWTAGATFSADFDDLTEDTDPTIDTDFTVYIESDMGGLYYGEYSSAVDQLISSPEGLTDGMYDFDDDDIGEDGEQLVLKGNFGSIQAAASTVVIDNSLGGGTDGSTFAITGDFGNFSLGFGYVEGYTGLGGGDIGFGGVADSIALTVATSFGGADVNFGIADAEGDTNYGIEVGYPVGPVALSVWFADGDQDRVMGLKGVYEDGPISVTAEVEDVDDGSDTTYSLEGTYDMGNGLLIGAGHVSDAGSYIGASYDLGGGATFLASYGDADTAGDDEISDTYGDFEVQDGITLEVSLSF